MPKKHTFTSTIYNAGGGGAFVEKKLPKSSRLRKFVVTPLLTLP